MAEPLVKRVLTADIANVRESVAWEERSVKIVAGDGRVVFERDRVKVPISWSKTSTDIVAAKYMKGQVGKEPERSVWDMIIRVTGEISSWGSAQGYYGDDGAATFYDELSYCLLHQYFSFNSPVWFNVGVTEDPQCSACFINEVEDHLGSIMELARVEAFIFKRGSGAGVNLSPIRGSKEHLSEGGVASGPVSFMRGLDSFSGAMKSGGRTRRAAKIVILDIDHPDIVEFIQCKQKEERVAKLLAREGYSTDLDGDIYHALHFQNANNSVRVPDSFMKSVEEGTHWSTVERTTNNIDRTFSAKALFSYIIDAMWECGDPGLQFDTEINKWNTCERSGRINASNPCGEFNFLDNAACNLASLNLLKFLDDSGTFNIELFQHVVRLVILAQDIIVAASDYPTEKIREMSLKFRPLGIGYSNLGALLMVKGLPYDSNEARILAASITALMTATAYQQSAILAEQQGAFQEYEQNEGSMRYVMTLHNGACANIPVLHSSEKIRRVAQATCDNAMYLGQQHGYRNAQVSLLAPTGTISFMMDCSTTGIEPAVMLVVDKFLAGGGQVRLVNRSVDRALERLGYSAEVRGKILGEVMAHGNIERCENLNAEHLPVFDCALAPPGGKRFISPEAHVLMAAAVQPHLSGAISKTVNTPSSTTKAELAKLVMLAWKKGMKSLAIYRENSKATQPLKAVGDKEPVEDFTKVRVKRDLPKTRESITHKFTVASVKGYFTVGLYPDGSPGELFIVVAKQGSTARGLFDGVAMATSVGLQYGVPLQAFIDKYKHTRFDPAGLTDDDEIKMATSILDYVFRWLENRFENGEENGNGAEAAEEPALAVSLPPCPDCGCLMERTGPCHNCSSCGYNTGCSG